MLSLSFAMRAIVLLSLVACGELDGSGDPGDDSGGDSSGMPWLEQFTIGNASINSAPIVTNQDGTSHLIIDDFILESALPSGVLEFFTIHVYIPVDDTVTTEVNVDSAEVRAVGGASSGDIYQDGEFVDRVAVGGTTYSVFRVTARDVELGLTRSDFANVTFKFELRYLDEQTKQLLNASDRQVGFYKR